MLTPRFRPLTRRRAATAALGLLLLVGMGCESRPDVSQTEEGRLVLGEAVVRERLDRGVRPGDRTLELQGFDGNVSLAGTAAPEAALTFVKRARGKDQNAARKVLEKMSIDEAGDPAAYQFVMRSEQQDVSSIDVEGTVPRRTPLRIDLRSGEVALSGIEAAVAVESQNGDVRIAGTRAGVVVELRNGSIEVGLQELPPGAEVRLRTINGTITLTLPGNAAAQVQAQTDTGDIRTEGLTFTNRKLDPRETGARFTGRLGRGGAVIDLRTENGSIVLREGRVVTLTPPDSTHAPADSGRSGSH